MAKEQQTFESFVQSERDRLNGAREEAHMRMKAAQDELEAIDRELRAISAYEQAKLGKDPTPSPKRAPPTNSGVRSPRGARAQTIIDLLTDHSDGLARGDILDKLGAKGNKSEEGSISNALMNLKKQGKIGNREGRYVVA